MGTSLLLRGFDGFLAAGAFFLGLVMAGTRGISFVAIASDAVADGLTVDECEYAAAAAEGLFRSKSCRSAAVRYDWEGGPLLMADADVAEFL